MDDEWERESWEESISRGGQVRRFACVDERSSRTCIYMYI